jgi:hypothetical protein
MAATAAAPSLPPYQPTSDADAREQAHQILGDAFDHIYTGDWVDTLKDAATAWSGTPAA